MNFINGQYDVSNKVRSTYTHTLAYRAVLSPELPWEWNFNTHPHPIPTGFLWEYPQKPTEPTGNLTKNPQENGLA